ncbi:MAG: phosphoribosyltransferase, partial [Muribaculum sp.]|nr:phosphoribosyltransferase [Muribaculum sp.]
TSPKRRHKEHNFASLICEDIHKRLDIPFYEDVAFCRTRQRINAVFDLNRLPEEPNVIVFDDFVTTGSTLKGMYDLLLPYNKTLLFVAGINNKL